MEELCNISQVGNTTREDDTCAELLAITCIANLLPYILGDVGHTRLDDRCEVKTWNRLEIAVAATHLNHLIGCEAHHSRAELTLQALDKAWGDIAIIHTDVGIQSRATDGDRGDVAQYATVVD